MPRISAPTVAEHRELVRVALVDAAERLLREGEPLTAGAVSQAAGIARNSIYRYVDSVDDLRGLVVDRYLPAWQDAVDLALEGITDPADRLLTWLRVNTEQAASSGHGWLMEVARTGPVSSTNVDAVHRLMRVHIAENWGALVGPGDARVYGEFTLSLLEASFRLLDKGVPVELVTSMSDRAARAMIAAAARQG